MLSKSPQFSLNRLPSKSILQKYAALMPFDTASTLMYILLQANLNISSFRAEKLDFRNSFAEIEITEAVVKRFI